MWYLQSVVCPVLLPIFPQLSCNCLPFNCFTVPWIPFCFFSDAHTHTHAHTSSGLQSDRAAAKGLTNAGWREVTALCITPWHWQLTDGYHSHRLQGKRGRGVGLRGRGGVGRCWRGREGERGKHRGGGGFSTVILVSSSGCVWRTLHKERRFEHTAGLFEVCGYSTVIMDETALVDHINAQNIVSKAMKHQTF